jgi:GTPase SAR1 family protein
MQFQNPVRNPFRTVQCPFCFEDVYPGECAVWSSINKREMVGAPKNIWKRSYRRVMPVRLTGNRKLVHEQARRRCPHCLELLPLYFDSSKVENFIIAIVGAGASGKSHYIAAMINELQALRQDLIGYTELKADGPTEEEYNKNYYEPLFVGQREIPLTNPSFDPISRPLVYRMGFPVPGPEAATRIVHLLIYDAAGEQIVQQDQAVRYRRYLLHASAIILLADPQKMDGIVRNLPYHLRPAPQQPGAQVRVDKAITVLNNVLELITQMMGLPPGSRLTLPIAVTLSKSDLLKSIQGLTNQPYFVRRQQAPYTHRTALLHDLHFVQREVYSFLQTYGDQPLLSVPERTSRVGYFAISATGHDKQPDGTYQKVEPIRCLDPLLWVLLQLGILTV